MNDEDIRRILLDHNDDFRSLYEEHKKLDERLSELQNKRYLSSEEEEEEREIKKKKLMIKDRMYTFITEYRRTQRSDN